LRWVSDVPAAVTAPAATRVTTRRRALVTAAALIAGIILGLAATLARQPVRDNSVNRFVIEMPASHDLFTGGGSRPVFSPDGRSLVYAGVPATGGVMLFRRAFDQLLAQPIPGTENATNPFFSPDGHFLAFGGRVTSPDGSRTAGIRRLDMSTGSVTPLLRCPGRCRGGFWDGDNSIWFSDESGDGGVLAHVPAAGGLPMRLGSDPVAGSNQLYPQMLPGGKAVLITEVARGDTTLRTAHVAAVSVDSGQRHVLFEGAGAQYTPIGHLVFAQGKTLVAVPFDPLQLKPTGTPVPVLENVQVNNGGLALFAFSNQGILAYVPGTAGTSRSLVWVDRQGREEPIAGSGDRPYFIPQLSPNGQRIAMDVRDQANDIYVWDIARRQLHNITNDPAVDEFPVWSPDSRNIAFGSTRSGAMNLFVQDVDSTNAKRLTQSVNTQVPVAFSRDGRSLFFLENIPAGGTNLRSVTIDNASHEKTLIEWRNPVTNVSFAPDDSWVAFGITDSGQEEIFVQPIGGTMTERHQISNGGGTRPRWSPDGQELFYIDGDNRLTSVKIRRTPSFVASESIAILPARYFTSGPGPTFDVSHDGDRFLMIKESSVRGQSARIVIVQNWFDELKRLVPTR
jgi:Tol biopolymer transport system component